MKLDNWETKYGTAENARRNGVKGRLVEVCDGEYRYVRNTSARKAEIELQAFASTADYASRAFVSCTIYNARGREVSTASGWVK